MNKPPSTHQKSEPFGKIIGLFAPLAAVLYFTGWIYRWAYYSFFHIEVTTLDLPFESFYLAAFQVLFGQLIVVKIIGLISFTVAAIALTLWLRQFVACQLRKISPQLNQKFLSKDLLRLSTAFIDEIVVVLLILGTLFWIARWQGIADAWKDAINATSTLPVVTVVLPKEGPAIGQGIDRPIANPLEFRVLGDRNLYRNLRGQALTDTRDSEKERVWRLLINRDGYFYIFPALPDKTKSQELPVVIIHEDSKQLVIISPKVMEE